MSKDRWFKCDPVDLLEGFAGLDTESEVAVYTSVLLRIYAAGGPIANNPSSFVGTVHISRVRVERTIASLLAKGKLFLVPDGRLMNPRAEQELDARGGLSKVRSKAGKEGGRPPKNQTDSAPLLDQFEEKNGQSESESSRNRSETGSVSAEKMAENSQSEKANAFPTRAREKEREKDIPPTPRRRIPVLDAPPEHVGDLTDADRTMMIERVNGLTDRDDRDHDMPALIAWIMREAKMVSPPLDTVLASSWVKLGCDPEVDIKPIVSRMCGGRPIRQFRYFDEKIREAFAAKQAAQTSNIAYFKDIARRYGRVAQR